MGLPIIILAAGSLFGLWGCNSSPSSPKGDREEPGEGPELMPKDGGRDVDATDGSLLDANNDGGIDASDANPLDGDTDVITNDGGVDAADASPPDASTPDADAAPPPPVDINPLWVEQEDCTLADMALASENLYLLCQGTPHRLAQCPLATTDLTPATCSDFISFEEAPYLNDEPLEIAPLRYQELNDTYSIVPFTSVPDHFPGFFIVDRLTQTITDQRAWEAPGIRVGSDVIIFPSSLPWGAAILGDKLLLAARNRDFSAPEENYLGGMLLYFTWNGDGTVTVPEEEAELGVPFVFTSSFEPTLFRPDTAEATRLLHNWFVDGETPTDSGWDRIVLDEEGRPMIDTESFNSLGATPFEPFKHLVFNFDASALFFASRPFVENPARLYVYQPEENILSAPWDWTEGRVVSAAWNNSDQVFFASNSGAVYRAAIVDGAVASVSEGITFSGEASASAFDASQGIYYLGRNLEGGQAAITAMLETAFDGE